MFPSGHELVVSQKFVCESFYHRLLHYFSHCFLLHLARDNAYVENASIDWPNHQQNFPDIFQCGLSILETSVASLIVFLAILTASEPFLFLNWIKTWYIIFIPFDNQNQQSQSMLAILGSSALSLYNTNGAFSPHSHVLGQTSLF